MSHSPIGARDGFRILLVILLATAVRFWLMGHTEVLARDSVDFIRIAARFESEPWGHVLRTSHQAPGYPAAIWAMSQAIRGMNDEWTSKDYAFAAQLLSVLTAILTTIPIYLTGRQLLDRQRGCWPR